MAGSLFVLPNAIPVNAGGVPYAGAKLNFYLTGTSTRASVYTDSALSVAHANPVIADANGSFAPIWLNGSVSYRMTLTTSSDVLIKDIDPVSIIDTAGSYTATPTGGTERTVASKLGDELSFRDFGAVGDGTTDDTTAVQNAIAAGGRVVGRPGDIYKVTASIPIASAVIIDLRGSTIKPTGAAPAFTRNAQTATASTTVSSGATIGSRQVVVASATGLVVGQWARITANDSPTHDASSYPDYWGKITNIASTTITLDRVLPVNYSGTISFDAYTTSLMLSHVHLLNGTIDGSACTYTAGLGQGARIGTVESVLVSGVTFRDFTNVSTSTEALTILDCVDALVIGCRFVGQTAGNQQASINYGRTAKFQSCVAEGSSFGLSISRCESAEFSGCSAYGRLKQEDDNAVTLRSIRGLKTYGCATSRFIDNQTSDFETGIRVQAGFRWIITGNDVRNCIDPGNTTTIALSVGSIVNGTNLATGIIANNVVENSGGNGIGVTSDTTGQVIITGNQVKDTQANGIYANVRNVTITGNQVENWNKANSTFVGIHYSSGATVTGNRFRNSDNTDNCLRNFLDSTYRYCIRDNASESGNPLGVTLEASGTGSISSAATTATITHTLSTTPGAADFNITFTENSTTEAGTPYITAVGATTATLNVRTAPGASNLDFAWKVSLPQPFTAP